MLSGLSLVFLALCGWAVWQLLSLVRVRIATAHLRRIPGPPPASFWTGNLTQFFSRDAAGFQEHVAHDFSPIVKLDGFLGTPILYVADPKALHTVLVKEEHIFQETPDFIATNKLIFGAGALLSTLGAQHGRQRKLLNPVFSVSHMRHMLPLFYNIVYKLRLAIESRVGEDPREIDMLSWMGRTALELIGQADSTNAYGLALKSLAPGLSGLRIFRKAAMATENFMTIVPAWLRRAPSTRSRVGPRARVKEIVDTMDSHSRAIYDRRSSLVKQVAEGKDIMSILNIAQMSVLIFAAMDTTSNSLSRILHLLAQHPTVQEKLREELLGAGAADGMQYDDLNRLPLLDSVCRETLRMYPPVTTLFRVATQDTVLPLSGPIYTTDGTRMDEIPLVKGSQVILGFLGCNTSKALWGEDAYEWKPERWLSHFHLVTDARIPGVYSNLMTFLGGKRACIGFKFSEMEMKVVLAVLLTAFTFELPEKSIVWNVAGVWYPSVDRASAKPEMPLKVGLYKGSQA
ncbi:cytochrome P450 [Fomitopsis serialis]|uniref:cytochrome P450 n=1 Tax=Fomitopsis serialis TaxID=139415 RepID=UPI0020083E7C|nr:cytochrome P450 [Neoantrodia serialis]KAH9936148.1 cytochrome P450 [Neoantrodia serialis]